VPSISPESYKPDEILQLVEMKQRNQLEITKCDKIGDAFNIDCPSCRRATAVPSEIFREEQEREKGKKEKEVEISKYEEKHCPNCGSTLDERFEETQITY